MNREIAIKGVMFRQNIHPDRKWEMMTKLKKKKRKKEKKKAKYRKDKEGCRGKAE
jgi:hypothetical protein